jgi:hypothetical protein
MSVSYCGASAEQRLIWTTSRLHRYRVSQEFFFLIFTRAILSIHTSAILGHYLTIEFQATISHVKFFQIKICSGQALQ